MSSSVSDSNFDYSNIGKTQAYINAQNAAAQESKDQVLGQEDFLMLLTTQLECQDPTQPVDNSQMVSQMSQLSMVESLSTISENMDGVINSVNSSAALTASSLVGRSVLVDSQEGFFDGANPMYAKIDAGDGATDINIVVKDANGTVVAEYTAASGMEDMEFSWDGVKDAGSETQAPTFFDSGMYTIEATAYQNGKQVNLPVSTYATVGSVTLGSNYQDTILNLVGYGNVTLDEVEEIAL